MAHGMRSGGWCWPGWVALALACLVWTSDVAAATYYLDSRVGNDAWSGERPSAAAGDGPWRSLARLSRATLAPGDTVVLACGSRWHETLALAGERSVPRLRIMGDPACTDAARPALDGAAPFSVWRRESAGIYSTEAAQRVQAVWADGRPLPEARYPAHGLFIVAGGDENRVQRGDATRTVPRGDGLPSNASVVGARVYVRTQGWLIEESLVAADAPDALRLASALRYPVRAGSGWYLAGLPWMLERSEGWAWEPRQGRLYLRLNDGSSPEGRQVQGAVLENLIRLEAVKDLALENLELRHAAVDAVVARGGNGIQLRRLLVRDSGRDAISVVNAGSMAVRETEINRSGRDGIVFDRVSAGEIIGNTLTDTGTSSPLRNAFAAINAGRSEMLRIERNRLDRTGYIGIRFGRATRVANNVVRRSCLVLDDCGAIYTWSGNAPGPLRSEVVGNIVDTVVGGREGAPDPWTLAAGIYLDDLTSDVAVDANTVSGAERGIYLHNAHSNQIRHNVVNGGRTAGIYVSADSAAFAQSAGAPNAFSGNTVLREGRVPHLYFLDRVGASAPEMDDTNVMMGGDDGGARVTHRIRGSAHETVNERAIRAGAATAVHAKRSASMRAVVLTNDVAEPRNMACPVAESGACAAAIDLAGQRVPWPLRLGPFTSRVVWLP